MKFVSLHTHTTFSYKDGFGMPSDHVERVKELGMEAVAFTEHGNVSSHVKAERAGDEQDIKTIYGCEVYAGDIDLENRSQRKNHLSVLAKDGRGYRNLLRVVSRAWSEGFYYEPTVSFDMLDQHREGLTVLSGCTASLLATSLIGGKNVEPEDASYDRGLEVARQYQELFGDNYFLEVQVFPELESVSKLNPMIEKLHEETGIPLVATADVHYFHPDQADIRKILHAVRAGGKFVKKIEQEFDYTIPADYPESDEIVVDRLIKSGMSRRAAEQALENTSLIAQDCNVTLPKIENLRYPLPAGVVDAQALYKQWIKRGWNYRGFNKLSKEQKEVYKARLLYESELIWEKGFTDYFLVLSDVVRYAKRNGIPVGPARGSAAASLVCYLLQITEVDPMKFPTLVFERFIDRNRHDLPDIDLDFDDDRRHEIREYLVDTYGGDRVGNIGTFVKFKGRNSIDDVARVYGIPKWEVETLKNYLIERSSGDLRASATIEDTVEMFDQAAEIMEKHPQLWNATTLEGNLRSMSVHAAGLVVANEPLTNACAVYARESKGEITEVVSLDKHDAEYLNVLKLDILGLKTMGMIRYTIENIGMTLEELYNIPLDDEKTLEGFRNNDVVGVFQFDGRAMQNVNSAVIPDDFAQVCDINALARPGPLHGGATAEYIDVKHGRKKPVSYGDAVDRITSHTYGQVVYQEQILQIVREVGDFSWEEAARIRKIISKKRGEQEFNRQGEKFFKGAQNNGLTKKEAKELWSMLVTAGAYAFNAAHCVSYGMLAYWTMWLKQNYPLEFFVGALRKYEDKELELLKDAVDHGLDILPPDVQNSKANWSIHEGKLLAGLMQVHGIGEKTAERILEFRESEGELYSWGQLIAVKGIGPKKIEMIQDFVNAEDPFGVYYLRDALAEVREFLRGEGSEMGIPEITHKTEDVPYDRGRDTPIVWCGIVTKKNLKDLYENHFSRTGEKLNPNDVRSPEFTEWVTMIGEDETGPLVVTIDRFKYPRFKQSIWGVRDGKDVIVVQGKKPGYQARKVIYVDEFWCLSLED